MHGRHKDAEEFPTEMIDRCVNLSNLADFNTKEKHTCTVCQKASYGFEELNRDMKSCEILNESHCENIAEICAKKLENWVHLCFGKVLKSKVTKGELIISIHLEMADG